MSDEQSGFGSEGGFREIEDEAGYYTIEEMEARRGSSVVHGDLEIEDHRRVFAPGDTVAGTARWHLPESPEHLDLRLHWRTEGTGTQDVDVVAEESWEAPPTQGSRAFRFRLPEGPYSFSGKLISLVWGLELVAEPEGRLALVEITVSPTGAEVRIGTPDAEGGIVTGESG